MRKEFKFNNATYFVDEFGNIYGKKGNLLKQSINSDGYSVVTLGNRHYCRTRIAVHRIVAKIFVPNPNNYIEVDHLDGNRQNPRAENLEWVTHQENIRRAKARGSYDGRFRGERNLKARLDSATVMELREKYYDGTTIQELSKKYNLPWSTVANAVKGITWGHLPFPPQKPISA